MSAEKNTKHSSKGKKWLTAGYAAAAIMAVVGAVLCACGISAGIYAVFVAFWVAVFTFLAGAEQKKKRADKQSARMGMIKIPGLAADFRDQDYRTMKAVYVRLGFRNVSTVNLHDLRRIIVKKPGGTEVVTIDGKKPVINEWYSPDAEVKITYHGFAEGFEP